MLSEKELHERETYDCYPCKIGGEDFCPSCTRGMLTTIRELQVRVETEVAMTLASDEAARDYARKLDQAEKRAGTLQARVAELETQVKRWEDLFAVTEEAMEDCRTGAPLLTHEEVFDIAPIPNDTEGLPKE